MKTIKSVLLIMLLACLAPISAATITHTTVVLSAPADWGVTNTVPQFPPSLGTLTNVTVKVVATASSTFSVENRDRAEWQTTVGSVTTISAVLGTLSTTVVMQPSHSHLLARFDGAIDYAGDSGFTANETGNASQSVSTSSVTPFVGADSISLTIGAVSTATYQGSGYYRQVTTTTAAATLIVTYEFSPTGP